MVAHGPQHTSDAPAAKASLFARFAALRPYLPQALCLIFGLLTLSNLALWLRVSALEKGPIIAVVGVRQMTQSYMRRIATSDLQPEEAAVRAKAFLDVAQDEASRLAPAKGRLVLARECVLSGETTDLTSDLAAKVERKLSAATHGLSDHVGPISASSAEIGAAP